MCDVIEVFGKSRIQHGKHNNRVYLMDLTISDLPRIIPYMDNLATTNGYTKIFAKVSEMKEGIFTENGYRVEAEVPGFYHGQKGAFFLGKYFCPNRIEEDKPELIRQVIQTAKQKGNTTDSKGSLDAEAFIFRKAGKTDVVHMADLYKKVFASYPFDIHSPEYLLQTMNSNVIYFGMWKGERLVALSSSEVDRKGLNAEMTDFATYPQYRGRGLANFLLAEMEKEMAASGIKTLYTIARAYSFGMNITFAKNGYDYSGTLTKNTNICGNMESMNIWHKPL